MSSRLNPTEHKRHELAAALSFVRGAVRGMESKAELNDSVALLRFAEKKLDAVITTMDTEIASTQRQASSHSIERDQK
jgi:hypothetical protein